MPPDVVVYGDSSNPRSAWPRLRSSQQVWVTAIGTALAYYIGARVGTALKPSSDSVSMLWPPNAILLGALLLVPPQSWPLVLVAVFPVHVVVQLQSGVPLPMTLCWFVSNAAEALIGAGCIRRFIDGRIQFDSVRRVGVFVIFGAITAPLLSSFLDVAFVKLNDWGPGTYWEIWRVRFFSNVLAILAFVPVIVAWGHRGVARLRSVTPERALEAAVLASTLLVVCTTVFARPAAEANTPALLYAPLPLLLWASVRFGPSGVSGCLLIFAVLSIWGAINGQGPFVHHTVTDNVLSLQLFLIVTYIPLMTLAAVIREREIVEDDARRNEERLSLALSAAHVGTWELDINRDRETLSEKSREILGVPRRGPDAAHGKFIDLVHEEDRLAVQAALTDAIQLGETCELEFRVPTFDGDRWIVSKGKVVADGANGGQRMLGVLTDVTDRRLAERTRHDEAALRTSEARFRKLADAMPQVVFTARPDGQIDYFNRKWYELTGTKPGPITDDTWLRIIHPDDRTGCVDAWRSNVSSGHPYEYEARFWSAENRAYRWHLARALAVRDESAAILHWYGTATDIDDHKRIEQALRDSEGRQRLLGEDLEHRVAERTIELSRANATLRAEIDVRVRAERALRATEERFAKAFRASPDAISIARLPEGRLIEINERWEAMFGISRSEAVGRTIDQLRIYVHQTDSERLNELMASQGYVREFEMDMRNRAGEPLRAVVAAETIDVGGEPCLITLVRDITERRRAEHEIVAQRRQLAHLGRV
ncbi:MAG: MASE1 domain-containing protein, partial [Gemmatimonadaceae bacterium]